MRQSRERLLEIRHSLSVGRVGEGLGASLMEVGHGLAPHLTPEGVVGEPLDVFREPVGMEPFERLHDPNVESPAPLLEEAPVGDLVGEAVFEGVLEIREEAGLVQELRGLQVRESPAESLLGLLGDGLQEGEGDLLTDDRRSLDQAFLLGREPVDPRRQDRLHCRRYLNARKCGGQAIGTPLADQGLGFDQRPHALFQEEGVPLCLVDQAVLEQRERGVGPQEAPEQFLGALGRQGVQAELGVVGLASPPVPVLRTIVDEQQEPRGREALDQALQETLALRVDPVQILERQAHGLDLAFPEEEALERLQGALAALGRIEGLPLGIRDRHVQESEERGQGRLQRRIQRDQLAGEFLRDLPRVVAGLDLEVRPEEVDDRQIGRGLAVGGRAGFEDEPAVRAMGMDELPEQPGLAHAGLAHHSHDLAVTGPRALERLAEGVDLRLAPHEMGEPAGRRGLHARAHQPDPGDLVHVHRGVEPLDGQRAQRLDLNEALRQAQRVRGNQDGPRQRRLFHPRGKVRGLADGGVVHPEVAADGAHDDLARIEAHANLDGNADGAAQLVAVPFYRVLHPQSGIAGPHGMVLVGERGAEEGHDAVAHGLVDGALVTVDGLHHALEHRIEELTRLLRVAICEQLH